MLTSGGNVISGNGGDGVEIDGPASTGNAIRGDFIGTDATGTLTRGNEVAGVSVLDATRNTIGGTAQGAGNVISGNVGDGVDVGSLLGFFTADYTEVLGNVIGLAAGGRSLPFNDKIEEAQGNHSDGVRVTDAGPNSDVLIAGNTVSGNGDVGVEVAGETTGAVILGNRIGTDAPGMVAIGNRVGVSLAGASLDAVGAPDVGNVISGNEEVGIQVTQGTGISQVIPASIEGNLIGTDITGSAALANGIGVYLNNVVGVAVGGRDLPGPATSSPATPSPASSSSASIPGPSPPRPPAWAT